MNVNFIIPIRHPNSVDNKRDQYNFLRDLFASISNQSSRSFRCFVVCNREQIPPDIPLNFTRVDVDMPHFDYRSTVSSTGQIHNYIRLDKGKRVAAAFDLLDHSESVMVVDDDDLLSNRLVDFVSSEKFDGIWTIDRGYGWQTGSGSAYLINQFHRICGSSLILPAFRYKYSNKEYLDIAEAYRELGSHRIIVNENAHGGLPIRRVPFRASIYRRGHINSEETKNLVTQAKRLQVSDYLAPAMRLKNRLLSRLKERFSKKPSIIFEHRVMEWRRVSISRLQDEFFG